MVRGSTHCAALVLGVLACSSSARAETYYVDPSSRGGACNDAGAGTSLSLPWCTLARANRGVAAGDTVVLRGGEYRDVLAPMQSGTAERRITFRRYESEEPVLTGTHTAIELIGRSYVTLDGLFARDVDQYVLLSNSHHVEIANATFDRGNNTSGWPMGLTLKDSSHHNWIHDSVLGNVGYSNAEDNGGLAEIGDFGDATDLSEHNLIERNELFHGGHHVLGVYSRYNVIRDNVFHNEPWMACPNAAAAGGRCGNREMILESENEVSGYNLIEGNRFAASAIPADDISAAAIALRTQHNIVRRNSIYRADAAGIALEGYGYLGVGPNGNHVYHNVFFHDGHHQADGVHTRDESGMVIAHHGGPDVLGTVVVNNIFWDNRAHGLFFYYVDESQQRAEGNWDMTSDPRFVNPSLTAAPSSRTLPDLAPEETSPCVDHGVFLTRTRAAGSGTTLVVEDAGFFTDGLGVISGDVVQLEGDTHRARLLAVDLATNTLTLDAALSFRAGQGVSLAYGGTAPDIGAAELFAVVSEDDAGSATADGGPRPPSDAGLLVDGATSGDAGLLMATDGGAHAPTLEAGCSCRTTAPVRDQDVQGVLGCAMLGVVLALGRRRRHARWAVSD